MNKYRLGFLVFHLLFLCSCSTSTESPISDDEIIISLKNTELYAYKTGITGGEEGAAIIVQARFFEISEIIRNAETRWEAVYQYKAKTGFTGTDHVEIEISTGSDGAGPPENVQRIKIIFMVY